jgi:outer membrane autotransporter protein
VETGRLGIDGTLITPRASVLQPGTLGGIGTIIGTVLNAGTVNPGNSVGTLTIVGSFDNTPSGVFQAEVTPPGAGDRLVVIGTPGNATVGGSTIDAVTGDLSFTPGQRFTVLTTGGTVGGTFGTLTTDFQSVFIDLSVEYLFNGGTPAGAVNQVDLVFARNGTMVNDVARTFNQRNVADTIDAIETIGAGAPAPVQTLINLIQNLDTERDVQDLLDNLSGEAHGSTESLLVRSGERFIASVLSSGGASAFSFASLAAAPGAAPQVASLEDPAALVAQAGEAEAGSGAGLWVRPFAVTGNIDSDGNASGFDFNAGGIAGGAAFEVAEGFFLGGALGYEAQETDFDRFGDNAEADTLEAAIYAGFEDGPLRVTGALGYAHHSVDVDRNVTNELGTLVPVTSDYDADQILAGAAGSYAIDMGDGLTVTPQAALTFARLDRDGFTERGATPGLLDVADETTESLLGRIGARIAMDFEMEEWTLTPAASLDVAHEFLDEFGSIDARFVAIPEAGSFTARGAEIGPTAVELGLGLAATDGEGLGLFLDYRGGFSSSGDEHSFAAGLRLSW